MCGCPPPACTWVIPLRLVRHDQGCVRGCSCPTGYRRIWAAEVMRGRLSARGGFGVVSPSVSLLANSRLSRRLLSLGPQSTQLVVLVIGWCRVRCRTFLEYGSRHRRQGVSSQGLACSHDWRRPHRSCLQSQHGGDTVNSGVTGAGGSPASLAASNGTAGASFAMDIARVLGLCPPRLRAWGPCERSSTGSLPLVPSA